MIATTFKTRFRTLFAMELAALWRDYARRFMLLLPILCAVVSPGFPVFFAAFFLGLFDFVDLGAPQSSHVEFLLTKAVHRHEAFLAKTSRAFTVGVVVVIWALAWPRRLSVGFPTWDAANEPLAFPYFLLLFLTYYFGLVVYFLRLPGYPLIGGALLGFCGVGAFFAGTFWQHCTTEGREVVLAFTYIGISTVFIALACVSYWSFSRLEPGVETRGRLYNRFRSFTAAMGERSRQQDAAKGRLALETKRTLPVSACQLRALLWLGLVRWARSPYMLLLVLGYSLALVFGLGIPLTFLLLFTPVILVPIDIRLGGSSSTHRFPAEFVRSLPVSRRLQFRTQMRTSFPMLLVVLSACVLLVPLGRSSDTTITLTDSAAQAITAEPTDGSNDHGPYYGFFLLPRGTFAERNVTAGRKAHVLTRVCLTMIVYLGAWLALVPGMMGGETRWREGTARDKVRALVSLPFIIAVFAFVFCGGPVVAWVFVLAFKHPVYMILGTLSICAALFHLAERQFVNIEVIA